METFFQMIDSIRARRRAAKVTQQELADEAGVSMGSVNNLEKHRLTNPTIGMMDKLGSAMTRLEARKSEERRAKSEMQMEEKTTTEYTERTEKRCGCSSLAKGSAA